MNFPEIGLTIQFFSTFKIQICKKLIGSNNAREAIVDLKIFGLSFILLLSLGASPLVAQERSSFQDENYKAQDEVNSDSNHINGPATIAKERDTARDSVVLKSSSAINPKADSASPKKEGEEETLSFNVLYFIIQKFKVSDIIN